jgi:hypothetical protein
MQVLVGCINSDNYCHSIYPVLSIACFIEPASGSNNMVKKGTSRKAAKAASKVLRSKSTGKASKRAAGSALTQYKSPGEVTSPKAAKAASKVLRDGRTSKASKRAAASTLAQAKKK